ncbi:hypothetical protein LEN26_018353 [Aphanomyces euteiches]|nr:hypothetical protein LEN26_018353 [Aphanomyces euteiches]KAH9113409.1 hypothetical protein AeMF1_012386 [Aphanomyces euteiches]KAH9182746.1 hypothetical protein AeNC1_015278 [Aphanomyces euteiches]
MTTALDSTVATTPEVAVVDGAAVVVVLPDELPEELAVVVGVDSEELPNVDAVVVGVDPDVLPVVEFAEATALQSIAAGAKDSPDSVHLSAPKPVKNVLQSVYLHNVAAVVKLNVEAVNETPEAAEHASTDVASGRKSESVQSAA